MSVHQKDDGRWFCVYRDANGKQKWEPFGRGDIAEQKARRRDEQVKEEKGRGPHLVALLTVSHVLNEYHKEHYVEASTKDSDFYRIDRLLIPAIGSLPAEGITHTQLNQYVKERLKTVKLITIDREIDILKSAYSWGSDPEKNDPPLISKNPLAKYRVPRDKESFAPAPPMTNEVERILQHAPQHLARALLIQWHCGLRPRGEVSRLSWSDFDPDARELRVISAKKGGPPVRYVPLTEDFAAILASWRQADEAWLKRPRRTDKFANLNVLNLSITHFRGRRVLDLKRVWNETKDKAGITRRLRAYDMRHAWFTNALRAGADVKATSETGGHSRVDTTLLTYHHVCRDQHRDVVARIPAIKIPSNSLSNNSEKAVKKI